MKKLFVLVIASVLLFACNKKPLTEEEKKEELMDKIRDDDNPYQTLRSKAFNVSPEELGLETPKDSLAVFGIVMDWSIDEDIATTVAFQTGDASLYFSSGGAVIGGGQYENVNTAAKEFVLVAKKYLSDSESIKSPIPAEGYVGFHLLTNKGVYGSFYEEMKNIENGSSKFTPLFETGNELITQIRNRSRD